jgi:glycerol uptake facilitator-like aquaporin
MTLIMQIFADHKLVTELVRRGGFRCWNIFIREFVASFVFMLWLLSHKQNSFSEAGTKDFYL